MTQTHTPASGKQAMFIEKLLDEREGYTEGFAQRVRDGLASGEMSLAKASEVITWLLERPRKAAPAKAVDPHKFAVPAGHYAATVPGSKEALSFFRVDTPTEGAYAGRTFVKHIVGGHPDYSVRGEHRHEALRAITKAGIASSALRYAQEFRRCLHCNTQLTDDTSRAIGIGPHCRKVYASLPLIAAVLAA